MSVDHQTRPNRPEIPNDILIRDEGFCREVFGRCARRTATRYECEGAHRCGVFVRDANKVRPAFSGLNFWPQIRMRVVR
jgi:hypothetical protein